MKCEKFLEEGNKVANWRLLEARRNKRRCEPHGQIKKRRTMNEQMTNNEWSFSGSTVALQWLYNEQWTNKRRTMNEQKTNKERTNDKQRTNKWQTMNEQWTNKWRTMSGLSVALQWLYSGSTTNNERTKDKQWMANEWR